MASDAEPMAFGPSGYKCRWCDQGAIALDYPETPLNPDQPYQVPVCARHARPAATPLPIGGCDENNCCLLCEAHLSDPHERGCPLDQCAGCGVAVDDTHYADCPEHGSDPDEQPVDVGLDVGLEGGPVDACDTGRADAPDIEPTTSKPCPGYTGAQ